MGHTWWHVWHREWASVYESDEAGDAGRREALAAAARIVPLALWEAGSWRVVPWSESSQDTWPWSVEIMAPVLRGEFTDKDLADELATRLPGAIVAIKGSDDDKALLQEGKVAAL